MQLSKIGILFVLAIVLFYGCSAEQSAGPEGSKQNVISDDLRFTVLSADSTDMVVAADYAICCGAWESGGFDEMTLKIMAYDTLSEASGWKLFILVGEASQDSMYVLPTEGAGIAHISMFVFDPVSENEWNSDTQQSHGTITLHSFSCGPPVKVDFTIDAEIASEYAGASSIRV